MSKAHQNERNAIVALLDQHLVGKRGEAREALVALRTAIRRGAHRPGSDAGLPTFAVIPMFVMGGGGHDMEPRVQMVPSSPKRAAPRCPVVGEAGRQCALDAGHAGACNVCGEWCEP